MSILNSNPTPDPNRNPNTIRLFHIAFSQRKANASMEVDVISHINMRKKLKKLRIMRKSKIKSSINKNKQCRVKNIAKE